jgi:hypothetical protein
MGRFFANLFMVAMLLPAGCGPKKEQQGPAVEEPKPGKNIFVKIHDKEPEISDPRTTLLGTIQEVIRLLEAENYRPIFEAYVCPDDRKAVEESGKTMDEVIQAFGEKRAKTLLKVLKDILQKEPVISEDGSTATFKLEGDLAQEAPSDTFVMIKTQGMWFIKN